MIGYTQPPAVNGISRRTIVVSVGLHLTVFFLVILSPLFRSKEKQFKATKFFQMVSVQTYRPPVKAPPVEQKPKPVDKPPATKPAAAKPKPVPSVSATVEPVEKKEAPAPAQEEEFVAPSEISVSNASFQYDWYLANVQAKVERYWQPPRGVAGSDDMRVVLVFTIERNGEITGLRLEKSSGNETLDHLGLRAIERAGPFSRLPPRFTDDRLEVQYQLNYIR